MIIMNQLPITTVLPDSFLDEECRCGYNVSSKSKAIWAVEIDLLIHFDEVCKKYNINYCVYAGSLLGAIRHKGFVPWDDDMDVCLDRENFQKLLDVPQSEFKSPYFLQTAFNDREYFTAYARFRNSKTTGIITNNISENYNNGIYIDVFVLDGYIEDEELFAKQSKERSKCQLHLNNYYSKLIERKGVLRKIKYKGIQLFDHCIISYDNLIQKHNNIISRYNDCTNRVTLMTHGVFFQKRYWCDKNDLKDLVDVPFEFIKVPVPRNYDEILHHMYGDYMTFPPIEERGKWHDGQLIMEPYIPYDEYIRSMNDAK